MAKEIYAISGKIVEVTRGRLPFLWKVAKGLLVIFLGIVIYRQVVGYRDQIGDFNQILNGPRTVIGLASVALLMIANWALEVTKWRKLLAPFTSVGLGAATKSVLSGISLALVTPARLGEYGGRLLGIGPDYRARAVMANGVGSIAQNIWNVGCGICGMIGYGVLFLGMNKSTLIATMVIAILVLLVMLVVYYRLDLVAVTLQSVSKGSMLTKLTDQAGFLRDNTTTQLSEILGLSFVRYVVYSTQYVLLVLLCGVTTDPLHAMIGVSVVFFIQSGIPLPPMLSVLARGEMAIWIWSVFTGQVVAILAATFLLWTINLVVPALVGAVIIWRSEIVPQ